MALPTFEEIIRDAFGPKPFGTTNPFQDLFQEAFPRRGRVTREKDAIAISMDLPGREKKHVRVFISNGKLVIKVEAVGRREAVREEYYLSTTHVQTRVSAKLRNGVLIVIVPPSPMGSGDYKVPVG